MNVQISGPYCPLTSYLGGKLKSEWVLSEDTNIRATFAREIARLRSPYYESAYEEVEADHHMMFPGGFER